MTKFGQIIFCVWQRRIWKITNYQTDKVKGFNSPFCIFLVINYLYILNTNKIRDSRTKMGRYSTQKRVFGWFSNQDRYLMSFLVVFIFRQNYFGYLDVGDGWLRPNVLVTSLKCWWPIQDVGVLPPTSQNLRLSIWDSPS